MREKFLSIICAFSLLFNSLFPIFSVGAVYAEDSTASATIASPSPSVSETPVPSSDPTIEPTTIPVPDPSLDPTPEPIISPSPEVSSEPIVETIPSTQPESTPVSSPDENTNQSNATPSESPSATPEVTPEVTPAPVLQGHLEAAIIENTDASSLQLDLDPTNVTSASLTTDKGDYAPTDTVIITGSDLLPEHSYILYLSSTDPPAVNFSAEVTTNEQGSFIYSYQLDGNYRPNYSVELKDEVGNIVASTTFTDAPVSGCTNDSAGANDQPNQKDLSKMCVNYSGLPTSINVSWNWDDTGFSGENTGDACSLYDTNGDGLANYSLCVGVTGNPASWSYTKLYSCGDGRSDRCDQPTLLIPAPTSTCSTSIQGTDPFSAGDFYPNDTEANCNVNMSDVGGSAAILIDVCSYPSGQPNSDPSDCILLRDRTGKLEVVKDLIPDTDTGLFNLQVDGQTAAANVGDGGTTGEKIVSAGTNNPVDHTVGETAGTGTSLGNYTSSIVCKDLNGTGSTVASSSNSGTLTVPVLDEQDIVCTITNTRINNGSITIIKDAQPNDAQDFAFTTTGSGLSSFSLDDDSDSTLSNTKTFTSLSSGNYSITETATSNWTLAGIGCVDNSNQQAVGSPSGSGTGTIALSAGQNVTCTFTNTRDTGTLRVIKNVTNNNGGTKSASDFTLHVKQGSTDVTGSPAAGSAIGTVYTLNTGSYTVSENTPPTGYNQTGFSGDCDSSGNIIVETGVEKTCTITNDDIQPKLTVTKVVVNDNGGAKVVSDFPLFVNTTSVTSGVQNGFNAGSYTVSEVNQSGYSSTISGDCASNGNITLAVGDVKSCTITNDDQAATLIVKKVVVNDNGGSLDPEDFSFEVNGGQAQPFESDGQNNLIVTAGTYNIVEPTVTGYATSYDNCSNVVIPNGGSATCTITNDDQAAHLIIIKQVTNDNGGTKAAGDFSGSVTGVTISGGQNWTGTVSPGVDKTLTSVGRYSVTENTDADYDTTYSTDCTGTITLGETKTCTVTNNDKAAHLIVIKHVINNNGGSQAAGDFTTTISGVTTATPTASGVESPGVDNILTSVGSYSVDEGAHDGYAKTLSSDCSGTIVLGQTKTCTITNDDIAPSLTLIKYLPNDDGGTATEDDFKVYINGQLSSWSQHTLSAGQYTVSEDTLIGYAPSAWGTDCDVDGTITLNPGDNKICTITNDDVEPTLTLIKNIPNNNGGTATEDDFNVYIDDESAVWGQNTVDAGDLTVSEDTLPGYEPSAWSGDCDEDGDISLLPGDNKTCEITNDDQPAHLILVKNLPNDNGGTATQDDFDVSIDEQEAFWGDNEVDAGSHTVNESTLAGYTPSAWGQDCDENGNVTLLPGETKTCTITNDDAAAMLVVKKHVVNDNGGTLDAINFTLNVTGNQPDPSSFPGSEDGTVVILGAGSYSVDEDEVSGYEKTLGEDCSGTIENGESKTCIITNDDQPGSISGTKWNDKDGNREQDCEYDSEELCELGLAEWTIFLDLNNNGVLDEGEEFELTDEDGEYTFSDLNAGTYRICEESQSGWSQTFPNDPELNNCHSVIVSSDEHVEDIDFGNQGQSTITVHKNVDNNGDGEIDETNATDWTWDIDGQGDYATGDNSQQVVAGSYTISEDQKPDYQVTSVLCNEQEYDSSESIEVSVEPGQDLVCTFTNTRDTGEVTIVKNIDNNGDGDTEDEGDVRNAQGWTYDIAGGDQDIPTGGSKTLPSGDYTISENEQAGYGLLSWSCSDEQEGTSNSISISVSQDSRISCTFTNQLRDPILTITKSNDKTGLDLAPGGNVLYTLTVEATQSAALDVSVTDLLPKGFVFRGGSWKVVSSNTERGVSGDITSELTAPTYNSPGTWTLGNMAEGETLTLTYTADIDGSQQSGLYKDLAWAKGEAAGGSTVLALAQPQGFVDTNFVGTKVNVVKGQGVSSGVNVENIEKREGEVLGASIALPETGIKTIWLILGALLFVSGTASLAYGMKMRRKYD